MTLAEANALSLGWDDAPPVYLSFKMLLEGLAGSGAKKAEGPPPEIMEELLRPGGKLDPNTGRTFLNDFDKNVRDIVNKSAGMIPLSRGPVSGPAPILDYEGMRSKNSEKIIERAKKRRG